MTLKFLSPKSFPKQTFMILTKWKMLFLGEICEIYF